MISHDLTSPRDARCGHYCSTGWGWVAAHAVACVRDGDRGRTSLQFARCGGPLVEFYGEGKGGSNPDFPSYSEGEVVEDEVSREDPHSLVGFSNLGFRSRRDPRNLKGTQRCFSFIRSMCAFYTLFLRVGVTCAVHLLRRVGLAAAPRARLGLFRLFTFTLAHFAVRRPSVAVL